MNLLDADTAIRYWPMAIAYNAQNVSLVDALNISILEEECLTQAA